jgi:DNA modification methylase
MTTPTALQVSDIHPIHPFPARMAPAIVWDSLPRDGRSLTVLDQMSGSGTTLVCARAKGHQAIGCDTDPLALLIARCWCYNINPEKLRERAEIIVDRARRLSETFSSEEAYPQSADQETRRFLDYWFDSINRKQLTALSKCIRRVRSAVERDLLWCALSRLIITKKIGVSLAMDVSHSRPHKVYEEAPVQAFNKFTPAVDYIVKKAPFHDDNINAPNVRIQYGDARLLPFKESSADVIITSPPYLNAIDYIRGHKLSLVWMGYPIKALTTIRSENIGSEHGVDSEDSKVCEETIQRMIDNQKIKNRLYRILLKYIKDMDQVFAESRRVLKKKGEAIFVIGDSTVSGVFIKNSEGLKYLAQRQGFQLISSITRQLPENRRYLPPPNLDNSGEQLQNRMGEEVIFRLN